MPGLFLSQTDQKQFNSLLTLTYWKAGKRIQSESKNSGAVIKQELASLKEGKVTVNVFSKQLTPLAGRLAELVMFTHMLHYVYNLTLSTQRCSIMRTNIVIDDNLMESALKVSGLSTKKDVVEQGLKLIIKRNQQQDIRKLRGKVKWEGDLDEMRGRK